MISRIDVVIEPSDVWWIFSEIGTKSFELKSLQMQISNWN